jgi:predicted RNase H-like nuclease (RuvC/YqgF family)
MSRLKDFLKELNFVSQCCNTTVSDAERVEFIEKRIHKLEEEIERCKEHQRRLRAKIGRLILHVADLKSGTS